MRTKKAPVTTHIDQIMDLENRLAQAHIRMAEIKLIHTQMVAAAAKIPSAGETLSGTELERLKTAIAESGYRPDNALILTLIEMANGYQDAKRYRYLNSAELQDPAWEGWADSAYGQKERDALIDGLIQRKANAE